MPEANLTTLIEGFASTAASNPYLLASMAIQFLLGFGLGYVAGKAFKYVLAFIGILALGVLLNVWSLGYTLDELLRAAGERAAELKDALAWFLQTAGLLSLGPASIGFLAGAVTALLRR